MAERLGIRIIFSPFRMLTARLAIFIGSFCLLIGLFSEVYSAERKPEPLPDSLDSLDTEQPIKEPKSKYPGPPADNSRCYVCHANYQSEKLTVIHLKANVGCVLCHGISTNHSTDEDNLTPPDVMYPHKGAVRFRCLSCHNYKLLIEADRDKKELKEPPDHQSVLSGTNKDGRFCMDCHSNHKLTY
ncbi:MAG: cytochrome c3 family protein [Verrucomicrobiia bacterium]